MSPRALIMGLVLAVGIAALGYLNDSVLRLTYLVGNHLPLSVFGLLILGAMLLNPLLYRLGRRRLRPRELAVIVAMMLVACSIPGSELMRTFIPSLALPAHFNRSNAGWRQHDVLSYAPDVMLPDDGGELRRLAEQATDPEQKRKLLQEAAQMQEAVIDDYVAGAQAKGEGFGLTEAFEPGNVPWSGWTECLTTWLPLILLISLCVICLGLIVHREWAYHERLRYPVALVASAIMEQDPDRATGPIFRNRLFWLGLVVVFLIHVVNGLATLYPDDMVKIPLNVDLSVVKQTWPGLGKAPQSWGLFSPRLYPTVAAFAFFLASDVSLSLGLSQLIYVPLVAALLLAGVDYRGDHMMGGPQNWQLFGSYLGTAILVGYIGRRYYWDVLVCALTFRRRRGTERAAVWACRVLIVGTVLMVAFLRLRLGLALPFSVLLVLLIFLLFVVMGRINVETGLFFLQAWWQPAAVLIGLFGIAALGPRTLVIVGLIAVVLTLDPRESLMPFLLNGLKICDDKRVRPGRIGVATGGTYVIALLAAVVVVFWASYHFGAPQRDGWAYKNVPQFTWNAASSTAAQLKYSGEFTRSQQYGAWQRVANMNPSPEFLWSVGIGLALVFATGFLRLRYTWWPLHPVIFLVWGTYPMANFSHSFLLGWLIKTVITRFGGAKAHRRAVPLMIGLIAGDLLGGLLWMAYGAAYYGVTGQLLDKIYRIFPG
jgi:hypothetical protein